MQRKIHIKVLLVTAVWLCAVSSCTKDVEIRSPVDIPEDFSEAGGAALLDKWWLTFDDPALHGLIESVFEDNLTVLAAWDRLDRAALLAKRAGSDLWPTLGAEAGAGYTFSNTGNGANFMLGLAAEYEVDLWGRVRSAREAAELEMAATEADLKAMVLSISAVTANTWYSIAELSEQLELLEEQVATNRKMLDLVTIRFRSGQASAADVLQQEQLIEEIAGTRALVRSQLRVSQHQLAVLAGRPPSESVTEQPAELVETPPLPQAGIPADLLKRRPDVQSAYYRVRAADKRVSQAIAERFPRLSLTARIETSGPDVRDLFSNWLANLGANLAGPIFDGGRLKTNVKIAEAETSEALHRYGQVMLDALREVEDALAEERASEQMLASLERQLELSHAVMERIRDNYTKGAEAYIRVLDTLLRHQALQRSLIQAKRDRIFTRIRLCRALAGSFELTRSMAAADDAKTLDDEE